MAQQKTIRYQQLSVILGWSFVVLLTAFTVYRLYLATTWGIGLLPDSLNYLKSARSIIADKNLAQLVSHWPPLYPMVIALTGAVSQDLLTSTRWLHAALYAANIVVFAYIVFRFSNHSVVATAVGALILSTSVSFINIHAIALSEPLFCLLTLSGLYYLARYFDGRKLWILAISSLLLGLACVTRYAGIAFLVGGAVSILLLSTERIKTRILACIQFCLIGIAPLLIWVIRNMLRGDAATSRELAFHPIPWTKIQSGIDVLRDWLFIPQDLTYMLAIALIVGAILYVFVHQTKSQHFAGMKIVETSFLFIAIYLAFLLASISLFDSLTPLDARILIPVYIFFLLAIIVLLSGILAIKRIRIIGFAMLVFLLLLSWKQFDKQTTFIVQSEINGIGFASREWVQSKTLQWLNKLDRQVSVYTNIPEPVRLHTVKTAIMLPRHTNPTTQKANPDYQKQMDLINTNIQSGKAIIVYFHLFSWRWYLPNIDQINQQNEYSIIFKSRDGIVLGQKKEQSKD